MVTVVGASVDQKGVISNLMQLYLHDLSEYEDCSPEADGLYTLNKYFDLYWEEDDRFPYLINVGDKPAGFILVRKLGVKLYSIAEFFIARPYRGKGAGSKAAKKVFDLHQGQWEVSQIEANKLAQKFWLSVIDSYTNGNLVESWSYSSPFGPKQAFSNEA